MELFKKLGLSESTLQVLGAKGFESPTPIQELTIPAILQGKRDIIAQAQTGTGKTAAFGLPLIELLSERAGVVQMLVLAPTRELAIQVAEEINSLKGQKKLTVIPVYGGQSIELQLRNLRKGVDVVVGTPGRIMDHINRRTLRLDKISYLVLDEADEMLNMGFIDDVEAILSKTPADKRTFLFSATMSPEIIGIAKKYMSEYDMFKATQGQLTVSRTDQIYFEVREGDKFEALCRIIDIEEEFYGLVFCRTKKDVDTICAHLQERGYDADALHGDISQILREKILDKFKKRVINILVATDVAARGIDVQDLSHVINYALPYDPEAYVHRIGRTGRAGKEGNAVTFVTPQEYRRLQFIKHKTKADIRKERLPKVSDIINIKKNRIKACLEEIVSSGLQDSYQDMAKELLIENSAEDILSAVLQFSFAEELDEKRYADIDNVMVDAKGKTRLYVKQGTKDGLTQSGLISQLQKKCNIPAAKIRDVQLFDKFAFVTLPFQEAETVLAFFKGKKGSSLVIEKAKKRDKK